MYIRRQLRWVKVSWYGMELWKLSRDTADGTCNEGNGGIVKKAG